MIALAPTRAQSRVLAALRHVGRDGWPVSVREVCAASGHASPSTVHHHLRALAAAGLVERSPRGIGWRAVG